MPFSPLYSSINAYSYSSTSYTTRTSPPDTHYTLTCQKSRGYSTIEQWLEKLVQRVKKENRSFQQLHPVIREFQVLIENDPELRNGFRNMFEEVPKKPPYHKDPALKCQIRDYKVMLQAFDIIIRNAPDFEDNAFLGFPINVMLNWPMGTEAGLKLFLLPKLNAQLKKVLDVWAKYLSSPESRSVLTNTPNGWFGPAARTAMPNFAKTFICDPNAPYYGFASWDDFFTRRFRPGVRPVDGPYDDNIINSPCEASVYRIAHDVRIMDTFWLKGEPYSLKHMLNNDELASRFVGGSIYQAYLSAINYHRWSSPVNGTILKTTLIPGSYYAESPAMGFSNPDGPDPVASMRSQGYLTSVATRAAIYIQADSAEIGLMVFLAVGMAEVSTCDVTVKPGQRVSKGDQLGMFHFGGSTHCLIFRPETRIKFYSKYATPGSVALLNAAIAKVET